MKGTLSCVSAIGAILMVALLLPVSSYGEFYKYRDENGVIRFTDNLAEVPKDQRPKVESYVEPSDFAKPEPEPEKAEPAERRAPRRASVDRAEDETLTPEERAVQLRDEKETLEQEYEAIVDAQKELASQRRTLKTPASYNEYNEQQKRLRERADAYERWRSDFEARVEDYNQSIEPDIQAE